MIYKVGVKLILDNPVMGVGPGNYQHRTTVYGFEAKAAYNAYVSLLSVMGFLGFIFYMLLYVRTFVDLKKASNYFRDVDLELQNMSESVLLSFLVFAVGQMAHVAVIDTNFVTLIGLSVVLKKIAVTPLCGSSTRTK